MSKSHITLEASELDGDDWTEATLTIERDDEPDEELRFQDIVMTKAEMQVVYRRLMAKYETGTWVTGSVER